jgi:glutamate racemase
VARNKNIGVFDSGLGGLTILRGLVSELPQYNYIYLGDTARTPYGARSPEVVYEFTKQAVDLLFEKDCQLIVLACNTASSEALRRIQQEYLPVAHPDKRVLGVLIPAAQKAVAVTKNHKVGVVATEGTVRSEAFIRELQKLAQKTSVFQQACPLLVPIVEAGEENSEAATLILQQYLEPVQKSGMDTLILGCTHYGLLKDRIARLLGPKVTIISEEEIVPASLRDYLARHPEIERQLGVGGNTLFYSTDITDGFTVLGSKFFGKKIAVEQISL